MVTYSKVNEVQGALRLCGYSPAKVVARGYGSYSQAHNRGECPTAQLWSGVRLSVAPWLRTATLWLNITYYGASHSTPHTLQQPYLSLN